MEDIEEEVVALMKADRTASAPVHLIAASQIIHSNDLYQQGLDGFIQDTPALTVEQSRLIGLDALHAIYTAITHPVSEICDICSMGLYMRSDICRFCGDER